MTHEFKTPLTNIALAGKFIIRDSNLMQHDKIKHYAEIILQENDKLRLQVEQVLSMSELERGDMLLMKTDLDFHQLIYEAVKGMNLQIENKNGNLKLNLKADCFVVRGDKKHLINAICNLIDNAIKYSKGKPEIVIQTLNTGHNLVWKISDNGVGIDKEYLNRVFEKFFRVPTGDIHDVKGFGLGLSYVKKIVQLHQGNIEIQSESGIGTTFKITIPFENGK